jgi:hypothetical protein
MGDVFRRENLHADLFAPAAAARKVGALMTARGPFKPHFAGLPGPINGRADGHHTAARSKDKPNSS